MTRKGPIHGRAFHDPKLLGAHPDSNVVVCALSIPYAKYRVACLRGVQKEDLAQSRRRDKSSLDGASHSYVYRITDLGSSMAVAWIDLDGHCLFIIPRLTLFLCDVGLDIFL